LWNSSAARGWPENTSRSAFQNPSGAVADGKQAEKLLLLEADLEVDAVDPQ